MQYILLIYNDETKEPKPGDPAGVEVFREYGQFTESIRQSGNFVAGAPLQPTTMATTVRVREGKQLVTDGPFAETREQLGGYYLTMRDAMPGSPKMARSSSSNCRIGAAGTRPRVVRASRCSRTC